LDTIYLTSEFMSDVAGEETL